MPFDVGLYVPERAAAALSADSNFSALCLGHAAVRRRLAPGTAERITVPIGDPDDPRGLGTLLFPGHRAARRRLGAFEATDGFDPDALFDLWVLASGFDGPDLAASVYVPGEHGSGRRYLADASTAASSAAGGAVFYGLDRSRFPDRLADASALEIENLMGTIEGVYAMPYFGSDKFLTPSRAVDLVVDETLRRFERSASHTGSRRALGAARQRCPCSPASFVGAGPFVIERSVSDGPA